jgi:FixJ family two-component response regulator
MKEIVCIASASKDDRAFIYNTLGELDYEIIYFDRGDEFLVYLISSYYIKILILDQNINYISGYALLKEINEKYSRKIRQIIFIEDERAPLIPTFTKNLRIDYLLKRPYSREDLLTIIKYPPTLNEDLALYTGKENKTFDKIITNLLIDLGFSPSYMGFYLIKASIELMYEHQEMIRHLQKNLYYQLSTIFREKTPENIEKNMRRSIIRAFKPGIYSKNNLKGLNDEKIPTTTEFLAAIITYLRLELN